MFDIAPADIVVFVAALVGAVAFDHLNNRHRSRRNFSPTKWNFLTSLVLGGLAALIAGLVFDARLSVAILFAAAPITAEACSWLIWRMRR